MPRPRHGSPVVTALLFIANALIPLSILIFATGFFPYKPFLPGLAEYEELTYGPPPPAPFDRLVFMVVDALRSDFVFMDGNGFEFTQQLIQDGAALPFTANARSPTVTMPRIKAITTGSIPSFLDAILNFDEADTSSTLAAQDTWLAQMKAKQSGKLIMFGDDTWLKLFPETFDRADGTSSFFVADFTEVDNNVTRHVPGELNNDDWSTMVLHYLGLDHIGHKTGPRGPNMLPKQREMDGVVRQIFTAMQTRPSLASTLLVLCGDHGMNDAGNHGASSAGETSTALVFVSPKLQKLPTRRKAPSAYVENFRYYTFVEQSDMAPTLGALLGFPIPRNNLGAIVKEFLPLWESKSDQIQILVRNARQILKIVTATFGDAVVESFGEADDCARAGSEALELACLWTRLESTARLAGEQDDLDQEWMHSTSEWLRRAQDLLSSMASNYDMTRLFTGLGFAATACVLSLTGTIIGSSSIVSLAPLAVVTLSYGIMMFASSYVEEEHHFWYWMSSAWMSWLVIKRLQSDSSKPTAIYAYFGAAMAATRLVRGWNQTGQKFAGDPDIVKSFLIPNPRLLWSLVGLTYLWVGLRITRHLRGLPTAALVTVTAGLVSAAFSFKVAFTHEDAPELVVGFAKSLSDALAGPSLVTRARAVFLGLDVAVGFAFYEHFRRPKKTSNLAVILFDLYTLFAMTQSRVTNIPLFLLFEFQLRFLKEINPSLPELSLSSIVLQYMSFFAFGGSNAISSVDLSSAYNGVSGFNVVAVGILTFVSNWAGPIYWTLATIVLLLQTSVGSILSAYKSHVGALTLFVTCSVVFVMAACTALRTHLFIWTVFSPKYLFMLAWSLGQHLAINILVSGLLAWASAS